MFENNHNPGGSELNLLSMPIGSKIPDALGGISTPADYDLYFHIVRSNPDLLAWSQACLDILDAQLQDLEKTSLTAEEQCQVLKGILVIQRMTLEKWVKIGQAVRREA